MSYNYYSDGASMSNEELARAISVAHERNRETCKTEAIHDFWKNHLAALLKLQLERAANR